MYVSEFEVESRLVVARGSSYRSSLEGHWPILKIWLVAKFAECPVCHQRRSITTHELETPALDDAIDFMLSQNLSILNQYLYDDRKCHSCGVASGIPEISRDRLKTMVKARLTGDWVRQRFAALGYGIMPKRSLRYDQDKAVSGLGATAGS